MRFVVEHPVLGASTPSAFLPANLFVSGALRIDVTFLARFDLVEQEPAGEEAVERLLARGLTFHLQPGRTMQQHDARGSLVDVLPAVSARTDERLFDVGFAHAEGEHALGQHGGFLGTDHAGSVAGGKRKRNSTLPGARPTDSLRVSIC